MPHFFAVLTSYFCLFSFSVRSNFSASSCIIHCQSSVAFSLWCESQSEDRMCPYAYHQSNPGYQTTTCSFVKKIGDPIFYQKISGLIHPLRSSHAFRFLFSVKHVQRISNHTTQNTGTTCTACNTHTAHCTGTTCTNHSAHTARSTSTTCTTQTASAPADPAPPTLQCTAICSVLHCCLSHCPPCTCPLPCSLGIRI